jgi:AcrR family transcriptional regulator
MNAAQRLFLDQGTATTTVEQITAAADVAKGTFYLYFSSKEDVQAALGDRFAELLLARIRTAVDEQPERDWRGRLAAWARSGMTGYLDLIRLHDIAFFGGHRPPRQGMVDNIIIDHLLELLRGGAAAGAWTLDDPQLTAVFLFSGLHGVVDEAVGMNKRINRSQLAQRLERLCLGAVGSVAATKA